VKRLDGPAKRTPQLPPAKSNENVRDLATRQHVVAMQVLKKLRQAMRLAKQKSDTARKRVGATNAQIWVLRAIGEHPGIRVTDLALATALHQSTISNLIERLRHRQLVRDKRDNIDARAVHLYLTAAGDRALSSGPSAPHNDLLSTLEHLSAKTLKRLDRDLTRLLDRPRE